MRNWWKDGIPFSCTQCGKCCHIRNDMAFVFVNTSERKLLATAKNISLKDFERTYCSQDKNKHWHLKFKNDTCIFLKGCLVFGFWLIFLDDKCNPMDANYSSLWRKRDCPSSPCHGVDQKPRRAGRHEMG